MNHVIYSTPDTHTHTGVRDAGGGDSARAGLHRNYVGGTPSARQVLQPGLVEGERAFPFITKTLENGGQCKPQKRTM
jgi:hypothetical protein